MQIRYDIAKLNGGAVGSEAMDFSLRSADGRQVMLAECFDNGYVLLDFWASWCGPCIKEIPKLRNLHEEYGDKLKIISISVDNEATDWRNAVEKQHLTDWQQLRVDYPVDAESYYFAEQADMSQAYGIEQIPCFILIDKNGIIVGRWSHLTHEVVDDIVSIIGR
ncbi:MAG: TlpA family protein disulfide reductase [Rikenellaceae bacterium]|nr:TlpA family protein disulfide reductase [Rikenellaceae bacterium]